MTRSKKISFLKKTSLFVIGSLFSFSCSDKTAQETLNTEIKNIDAYVTTFVEDGNSVIINAGASRIIQKEGSGEIVEKGDSVYFNYAGYIFSSGLGTIFDTNMDSLSSKLGLDVYNRGFNYGKAVVGKGDLVDGLERGLLGAKEREYSYIVFPSSLGYGDTKKGVVPSMSSLIFEIWILNVVKN